MSRFRQEKFYFYDFCLTALEFALYIVFNKGNYMLPHFSDPERSAALDMQKLRIDQYWRKGEIGDATYLRSLFVTGYLPDEANTELNLLKLERK